MRNADSNQTGWVPANLLEECEGCEHSCHQSTNDEFRHWREKQDDDEEEEEEDEEEEDEEIEEVRGYLQAKYSYQPTEHDCLPIFRECVYRLIEDYADGWLMVQETTTRYVTKPFTITLRFER